MKDIRKIEIKKGLQLFSDSHYKESGDQFVDVITKYGEDPITVGFITVILESKLNQHKAALPYAKRSVELSEKSELASINLVHCLLNLGLNKDAENEIIRFLKTGSDLKLYNVLFDENNLNKEDFR